MQASCYFSHFLSKMAAMSSSESDTTVSLHLSLALPTTPRALLVLDMIHALLSLSSLLFRRMVLSRPFHATPLAQPASSRLLFLAIGRPPGLGPGVMTRRQSLQGFPPSPPYHLPRSSCRLFFTTSSGTGTNATANSWINLLSRPLRDVDAPMATMSTFHKASTHYLAAAALEFR